MPPRPTLSANSFGLSYYIYPPFCKHCAIATVGLQLSIHNRLSRFLQPPCALSPLPWGGDGGGYSLSPTTQTAISPVPWGGEGGGFPYHQPHKQPYHPSLGDGTGRIFPTTNHQNSPVTPPLGRGWGWVFPAPASLQSLRKKFTGPSVNFLQGPWSNLTAALENYYKAPGALLQGCWRNLTDTPGKPATAAIMHKKVHLRSAERKKRRLFYCIARAF